MGSAIKKIYRKIRHEKGAVLITVALLAVVLLAFAALGLDIAHLYVVKNELQNAADAGALAGARCLYDCIIGVTPGSVVNINANQIAYNAAIANKSEKVAVKVEWTPGTNTGDIVRGHWSFATRTFTPLDKTTPPQLWNITTQELDNPTNENNRYVNAIKVITRRKDPQADSFFARILGFAGFDVSAEAIAYIGFAGQLYPTEADQPIGICRQAIVDQNGNYTCGTGRMLNSGSNSETHNTAGWTNFSQPCKTANANEVRDLVCAKGNPNPIILGQPIGATGGTLDKAAAKLRLCFGPETRTTQWQMTLPVVDCPGNNVGNCATVLGAVTINIVWVSDKNKPENDDFPPAQWYQGRSGMTAEVNGIMKTWYADPKKTPDQNWDSFVAFFNLKNVDNLPAVYAFRSFYFLPSCAPHEPTGVSGGKNYGILAKVPVLVN